MCLVRVEKPKPPESPEACVFSLSNEPLRPGETLRARIQKKLISVKDLPKFRYVDTQDAVLGGKPAIVMRFTWESSTTRVLQRVIGVEITKASGTRSAVIVNLTSSEKDDDAHQRAFDEMLASFRFASNGA